MGDGRQPSRNRQGDRAVPTFRGPTSGFLVLWLRVADQPHPRRVPSPHTAKEERRNTRHGDDRRGNRMLRLTLFGWVWVTILPMILVVMLVCVFFDTSEGWLSDVVDFFMFDLPNHCLGCIDRCCGRRVASGTAHVRALDFVAVLPAQPVLQGFYLLVILGAYGMAVVFAYPQVPCLLLPGCVLLVWAG